MACPIVAEPRSAAVIMEAESKARKERAAMTLERMKGENVLMKASWCQQLKLASQYLGLRPVSLSPPSLPPPAGQWPLKMKIKKNDRQR